MFREFESPRKMYGSSLFKLNYINNGTMESFSSYKALSKVWMLYLEVQLQQASYD